MLARELWSALLFDMTRGDQEDVREGGRAQVEQTDCLPGSRSQRGDLLAD